MVNIGTLYICTMVNHTSLIHGETQLRNGKQLQEGSLFPSRKKREMVERNSEMVSIIWIWYGDVFYKAL